MNTWKPPIRGKVLNKPKIQGNSPMDLGMAVGGVAQLIMELRGLKQDLIDTTEFKIKEMETKTQEQIDILINANELIQKTHNHVIEHVSTILQGPPGLPADEEKIAQRVESKIPAPIDTEKLTRDILAQVPKLDTKALTKTVLEAIPQNKASLKIIQEKFEVDPMSVIEKIMSLPEGKFKLKTAHIDGLEQTMSAFRNQLGRGYLHGGGDVVEAGSNITITTTASGKKRISSSGGTPTINYEAPLTGTLGTSTTYIFAHAIGQLILNNQVQDPNLDYSGQGTTIADFNFTPTGSSLLNMYIS